MYSNSEKVDMLLIYSVNVIQMHIELQIYTLQNIQKDATRVQKCFITLKSVQEYMTETK